MKAVIGTTFQVHRARLALVSLPPSGPSPKSFPNVRQIKTKHGEKNTTLQSSDFWWAISAGDSSLRGGGPYLVFNMKQAATLGYIQLEPSNVPVHCYPNTHELLLCLEIKATQKKPSAPHAICPAITEMWRRVRCAHTWTSSISTLTHTNATSS